MRLARPSGIAAVLVAGLAIGGCDKDTTKPQPATPLAQLETVWPNEDQRGWVFAMKSETWLDTMTTVGFFKTAAAVPPAPTVSTLMNFFANYPKGDSVTADSGSCTFQFNGEVTTLSGVTAQNAVVTMSPPVARLEAFDGRLGSDPVLRWLHLMRPDLFFGGERGTGPQVDIAGMPPLFLRGYAWRKRVDGIIGYGDRDTLPSWRYLNPDIVTGAMFTHHLVPSLANDLFLHGHVVGTRSVTTRSGIYPRAIVVDYLVDYGVSTEVGHGDEIVAYYRQISFGSVAYVDSLGPVACMERHAMRVGKNGTLSSGFGQYTLGLVSTIEPPPIKRP
jgi:hypothetical protein